MKKLFRNLMPGFAYLLIVLFIFKQNYIPGTVLTGWDNLHPEFDFKTNIGRSIFAVWQEYQGLGLLGGMGHASDLVHQIFLLILSLVLPTSLLRYTWVMLVLLLGSLGTYFLIKKVIFSGQDTPFSKTASFLGGLFYLLNLSTIQMFYVPFEAFIGHYAALPWLLFASINYWREMSAKNLLLFSLVLFLSTPAAYIPTLFVVYVIAVSIIIVSLSWRNLGREFIIKSLKFYLPVFIVNSFWLLPFLYFTLTNSQVNLNSRINQMATDVIYAQNKEFGDIFDVALLKGFWFNNVDPDKNGSFEYMLLPWKNYFNNPFTNVAGYLLFGVCIAGLYYSIKKRENRTPVKTAFGVLFIFSFIMLTTSTPPFSWLNDLFRDIPLFFQAFRFPFTKFSILMGFSYAVFFVLGLEALAEKLESRIKSSIIIPFIGFVLVVLVSFPVFSGNLFYNKEKLSIPNEYYQTFDYFKNADQNTRIANLPQPTYWGWTFYNWGYGGSGFLWYGIKQPIIDRAFDVWSKTDENYYFELTNAIYSKSSANFNNVLNKYQINYLMLDKNVIYPNAPKSLFVNEIKAMVSRLPNVKLDKTFGSIEIYKVNLATSGHDFVYRQSNLPSVNNYSWTSYDKAYEMFGNYGSGSLEDYVFPFRSLFSLKTQNDNTFAMKENGEFIELTQEIDGHKGNLNVPSFIKDEDFIPIGIILRRDGTSSKVTFKFQTPVVFVNGQKVWEINDEFSLFPVPNGNSKLNINGAANVAINKKTPYDKVLMTTFLTKKQDNIFVLTDTSGPKMQVIPGEYIEGLTANSDAVIPFGQENTIIKIQVPKVDEGYLSFVPKLTEGPIKNCDNFRKGTVSYSLDGDAFKLKSKNGTACASFYKATLPHKEGYAIFIEAKNVTGKGLQFWVENNSQEYAPIDTYLPIEQDFNVYSFILPSMEEDGSSYAFHLYNTSIGSEETSNEIKSLKVYPFPYNFLTSIYVSGGLFSKRSTESNNYKVFHPNESLYVVNNFNHSSTLILSQSYDPGWKAYEVKIKSQKSEFKKLLVYVFPFVFGSEIKNHIQVNNWENGWIIDQTADEQGPETILIVYLPQYLEYIGFLMLFSYFVYLIIKSLPQ